MHLTQARQNAGKTIGKATRARLLVALVTLALVAGGLVGWQLWRAAPPADAATRVIRLPFAAGPEWIITEGYRTDPATGGTHYDCDPATALTPCRATWQYGYALTFNRADGMTAGETVLAPASGSIRWIDPDTGTLAIDLGDGYVIGVTTATIDPALTPGQTVRQGQPIGRTIAPKAPRISDAPRIRLALWRAGDGQRLDAAPFTGDHALDGSSLPSAGGENQYHGRSVVSTNAPAAIAGPAAPALTGPRQETRLAAARSRVTLTWHPVPGADAYRVEINGESASPWVGAPAWTSATLGPGTYSWRVRARDDAGVGPLSAPFTFTIAETPAPAPATNGQLALKTNAAEAEVGTPVRLTGTGFTSGETVTLAWDDQPLASARTGDHGAFAADLVVPPGAGGEHTVTATGTTGTASAKIRVRPSLARGPSTAAPGSEIAVAARGFGANEPVSLTWQTGDGPKLGTIATDASGSGSTTVALPDGPPGWHDYAGTGETSKARAFGAIEIQPDATLSSPNAAPGDEVRLTARGLPAGTSAGVTIDKTAGAPGTLLCHGQSDADGRFSCAFPAPDRGAGAYPVTLSIANGVERSLRLTIDGPTAVAITPGAAAIGTNVTLALGGFAPREAVALRLGDHAWRTVAVDADGALSLPTTVPPLPVGPATLTATGVASGRNAHAPFAIVTVPGDGPDVVAPGVYRVTATREGLVGETTSTGHVIVPDDHFVSLPACVASNCPWLRAAEDHPIWGVRTECGDRCYVKVINPANRSCAVAPVWDVGPWFRSDDWWRPTGKRRLNTKLGSPNTLAQGYPAAEAARLGIDVGYGTGPEGYGASDRYADVGNRAAIDLADGTWNDLGLDFERAYAEQVEVQLLWQTGQTRAEAARGCHAVPDRAFTAGEMTAARRGKLTARWPLDAAAAAVPAWVEPWRRRS